MKHVLVEVTVKTVVAGKLRRYHGVSLWRQALDLPTVIKNTTDVFKILVGFIQSFTRMLFWRPDVVFMKGGFVCLPVGFAAHILRIPLIIHDSDTLPGLTNRVLARYASRILTGAPLENYSYSSERAEYVGIPVDAEFYPRNDDDKRRIKKELHLDPDLPLLVVTGGGLGALRINQALLAIAPMLKGIASVVHIAGARDVEMVKQRAPKDSAYKVFGFVSEGMPQLFGAADVVITRAGANTLQELAASAAPTIIIPNGFLTGGHQLKNAAVFERAGAAIVLDEPAMADYPEILFDAISALLESPDKRQQLAAAIHSFARPDAAKKSASVIIKTAKKHRR